MSKGQKALYTDVIKNKKVFHEYEILETYEVGISLAGAEIKQIRKKQLNIREAYVKVTDSLELVLINMNITPYEFSTQALLDPSRTRKLLMHKRQIRTLKQKLAEKGLTVVPIKVYFKNNLAKLQVGLAKGKKVHDKRQTLKERDIAREMDQQRKNYR